MGKSMNMDMVDNKDVDRMLVRVSHRLSHRERMGKENHRRDRKNPLDYLATYSHIDRDAFLYFRNLNT